MQLKFLRVMLAMYQRVGVVVALSGAACASPHILSGFGSMQGEANGEVSGERDFEHDGVDIEVDESKDQAIASADGLVTAVTTSDSWQGITVVVLHDRYGITSDTQGGHYATLYGHLSAATVSVGQRVARGANIGHVGMFVQSGGIRHIHWGLCDQSCEWRGEKRDPLKFTAGCFDKGRAYESSSLVLTYPVEC